MCARANESWAHSLMRHNTKRPTSKTISSDKADESDEIRGAEPDRLLPVFWVMFLLQPRHTALRTPAVRKMWWNAHRNCLSVQIHSSTILNEDLLWFYQVREYCAFHSGNEGGGHASSLIENSNAQNSGFIQFHWPWRGRLSSLQSLKRQEGDSSFHHKKPVSRSEVRLVRSSRCISTVTLLHLQCRE